MMIIIGKPYIVSDKDICKLCSDIKNDNGDVRTLYFEFEKRYEPSLLTERSDPFVLALLNSCMYENKDIQCECPMTERLFFQLISYYIPVISKTMPELNNIKIFADVSSESIATGEGVMTGNSGGVDSLYSVLKHINTKENSLKLTHLLFNNIASADNNEKRIRQLFDRDKDEKRKIADKLGLEFVSVYTNLHKFYSSIEIFNFYFSAQFVSVAYAISKLINVYYFSSGVSFLDFSLERGKIKDSAYFDLFSSQMFSSPLVTVYSSGSEVSRLEKTRFISESDIAREYLQVCSIEQFEQFYLRNKIKKIEKLNCGECTKCMRTISTLHVIDKLENFYDVFDLRLFHKNKDSFIAHELAADSKEMTHEIKETLIKRKEYNFKVRAWYIYWRIYEKLRMIFRQYDFARKIYYKYKK